METDSVARQRENAVEEEARLNLDIVFERALGAVEKKIFESRNGIYPFADVEEFLAAYRRYDSEPFYRDKMKALRNGLEVERGNKIRGELDLLVSEADDAYRHRTRDAGGGALKRYQKARDFLARLDGGVFSEERKTVTDRLREINDLRDASAYKEVKQSLDTLQKRGAAGLESAIAACTRYLELENDESPHHNNAVESWKKYLAGLQELPDLDVEFLALSVDGSTFTGSYYDNYFGWHYLRIEIRDNRGKLLAKLDGDEPPKTTADGLVGVDAGFPSYFRIAKSPLEFKDTARSLKCRIGDTLKVRLSSFTGIRTVKESTVGTADQSVFSLVWNNRRGEALADLSVYADGARKGAPAKVLAKFTRIPAPPEPLP